MNGGSAVPNPANVQPQPHAIPPTGAAGVMPISANGGASAAGGGAGTPDYSAQWIEYYRSIGKNKEADMVEQQVKARVSIYKICITRFGTCFYGISYLLLLVKYKFVTISTRLSIF